MTQTACHGAHANLANSDHDVYLVSADNRRQTFLGSACTWAATRYIDAVHDLADGSLQILGATPGPTCHDGEIPWRMVPRQSPSHNGTNVHHSP